jgi:hypothetical protein
MTQAISAHLGESPGTGFFSAGTETTQALIVGRAITGIGAFT